ncbi:MAG: HDIG domain-containing protein [Proteobacteria bacterium]|nr:HDIG domain-containing protein [Pseudomonadota bacterium]
MDRAEALALMESRLEANNLRKHCLASEAIMRALARRLGHDENLWGLAGLLHDLDYDQTKDDPGRHGLITEQILADRDLPSEVVEAIKRHNAEALGIERKTPLDLALTAAETMTGMVVAATLVYPDRKVKSVKPKSIVKRMKEKQFARGARREHILLCEELGVPLTEFAALSLSAMSEIDDELGL